MAGVMPTPDVTSTMLSCSSPVNVNVPDGAVSFSVSPTLMSSCRKRETRPCSSRLTVISRQCGRLGVEAIV